MVHEARPASQNAQVQIRWETGIELLTWISLVGGREGRSSGCFWPGRRHLKWLSMRQPSCLLLDAWIRKLHILQVQTYSAAAGVASSAVGFGCFPFRRFRCCWLASPRLLPGPALKFDWKVRALCRKSPEGWQSCPSSKQCCFFFVLAYVWMLKDLVPALWRLSSGLTYVWALGVSGGTALLQEAWPPSV